MHIRNKKTEESWEDYTRYLNIRINKRSKARRRWVALLEKKRCWLERLISSDIEEKYGNRYGPGNINDQIYDILDKASR
jgi:hypothetical protein